MADRAAAGVAATELALAPPLREVVVLTKVLKREPQTQMTQTVVSMFVLRLF